jgi:poly-gamma-glutamate synthesis protein (capsule biosynthesis protein)
VNSLNYGGFDIVSLANNHAMDYGKIALLDTINILSENGISQVGAGKNIYESYSPKIFQIKGLKIGFLAYSTILPANSTATSKHPGIAYARSLKSKILDKEIKDFLRKNIKIVRNKVDFLIISVHWGEELNFYPSPLQIQLGHFLIDSGADLVIGHHPHVVQGIEKYKGKLIVYSLGNFVFASKSELTKQSFILKTTINKDKKVKIEIIPILISKSQPQIISGRNALEILKRIKILSFKLNTNISIAGEKGVLENF